MSILSKGNISILISSLLSIACPVGYTEMTSNATKTCLRFVDTPTNYLNATINCKMDGGDLVKLDTEPLKNIFLEFIDGMSYLCYQLSLLISFMYKDVLNVKIYRHKHSLKCHNQHKNRISPFYHGMFLKYSKLPNGKS